MSVSTSSIPFCFSLEDESSRDSKKQTNKQKNNRNEPEHHTKSLDKTHSAFDHFLSRSLFRSVVFLQYQYFLLYPKIKLK